MTVNENGENQNNTRNRLIKVIAEHYLGNGEGKLTIQLASTRAGISRQAFNRYYNHLKPYVLGQLPIAELLTDGVTDLRPVLEKTQERVRRLQDEVDQLLAERDTYLENVRISHITTLMNDDLTFHNSNELRSTMEKQILHNDKLIKDIKRLEVELTLARASASKSTSSKSAANESNLTSFISDLSTPFRNYFKSNDVDAFEAEKNDVIEKTFKKAAKIVHAKQSRVVVYIERYISSYQKHVLDLENSGARNFVIINAPLYTPTEIKLAAKLLPTGTTLAIHVPFCNSEPVLKAQRKFLFQHVPDIEFEAADRMALPSIREGFARISFQKIEQGD